PLAQPGNINNAGVSVTLQPVGPGATIGPVSCAGASAGTGYATKTFSRNFAGVAVNTYDVTVVATGNYYTGGTEGVLTVYDPSLGFTTGGGTITWPDGTGDKTNFGFTLKYNKNQTNVQGSLLVIRHSPNGIYRIKSNALGGLSIGQGTDTSVPMGWASFSGKATYLQPGWTDPVGNYSYVAYGEDRNEPGTLVHRFWLQVYDSGGNAVGGL